MTSCGVTQVTEEVHIWGLNSSAHMHSEGARLPGFPRAPLGQLTSSPGHPSRLTRLSTPSPDVTNGGGERSDLKWVPKPLTSQGQNVSPYPRTRYGWIELHFELFLKSKLWKKMPGGRRMLPLGGCVILGKSGPPLGSSFLLCVSGHPRDPQR